MSVLLDLLDGKAPQELTLTAAIVQIRKQHRDGKAFLLRSADANREDFENVRSDPVMSDWAEMVLQDSNQQMTAAEIFDEMLKFGYKPLSSRQTAIEHLTSALGTFECFISTEDRWRLNW